MFKLHAAIAVLSICTLVEAVQSGQAPALTNDDWQKWLTFVRENHSCRMYVLLMLTGMFALRCGESCMLNAQDFLMTRQPPVLRVPQEPGRAKSPGDVPIMPDHCEMLKDWMSKGVTIRRVRENQHGIKHKEDTYIIPSSGRLFRGRRGAKANHISYAAVWAAINKLSKKFDEAHPNNGFQKIRSHSGRATSITLLMGEGMPLAVTMRFARHQPSSVRTHLKYGQLTCDHVRDQMMKVRRADAGDRQVDVVADPRPDVLKGCTLRELVGWFQEGLIDDVQFEAAKNQMLGL